MTSGDSTNEESRLGESALTRRDRSVERVVAMGLSRPPIHLPALESTRITRSPVDVVRRVSCLSAVAAVAHGCPVATAARWMEREQLLPELTGQEQAYLGRGLHTARDPEAALPEGIYALAWTLGWVSHADELTAFAPDNLVTLIPTPPPSDTRLDDVHVDAPTPSEVVLDALDLAYCTHWALVDSRLNGRPVDTPAEWVVVERRRAWEWLVSDDAWDEISLDT